MFVLVWSKEATKQYNNLKVAAEVRRVARKKEGKKKSSKDEGLFKQVCKALQLLKSNPRHPGLQTHEYHTLPHPWDPKQKVLEAYIQNKTPGAYRLFWCYGQTQGEIYVISITPHP